VLALVASTGLLITLQLRSSGAPGAVASPSNVTPAPSESPAGLAARPTATAQASTATAHAPAATRPASASGAPRLGYAEFLLRVNDDRSTVDRLNRALSAAVDTQDPDAVRRAAVDILDFVDAERDWLRAHPPAECYTAAQASATAMLDAYGAAADQFVAWSASGGGLEGLGALGRAVDAASAAGDALASFGKVLEVTSCRA